MSSVTGPVVANPDEAAYCAAKAGVVGLTRGLALDVAKHGVTVNAVGPGWIATGCRPTARTSAGSTRRWAAGLPGGSRQAGVLPRERRRQLHHRPARGRGRRQHHPGVQGPQRPVLLRGRSGGSRQALTTGGCAAARRGRDGCRRPSTSSYSAMRRSHSVVRAGRACSAARPRRGAAPGPTPSAARRAAPAADDVTSGSPTSTGRPAASARRWHSHGSASPHATRTSPCGRPRSRSRARQRRLSRMMPSSTARATSAGPCERSSPTSVPRTSASHRAPCSPAADEGQGERHGVVAGGRRGRHDLRLPRVAEAQQAGEPGDGARRC